MHYMADCELHRAGAARLTPDPTITYPRPPAFRSLPLAQWFQTAHTTEILGHVDEMKAVVTSVYGKVLKIDSTKKVIEKEGVL